MYVDHAVPGDESAALQQLPEPHYDAWDGHTYGGLKVRCENAAEAALPGRVLVVRSGLIVGPHDPTDRFTYWPMRFARGGTVLVPGPADMNVEFTHGADLAAFVVDAVSRRLVGPFDTSGPTPRPTLGAFVAACREVAGPSAEVCWVDEAFVEAESVAWWSELPLCTPPDMRGFTQRPAARAHAAGLTHRPVHQTVAETLAWASEHRHGPLSAGLTLEREVELLAAWTRWRDSHPT